MKSWKKKRKWSSCSRSTCRMRVLFDPSIMSYWPNSVLPLTIAMSTVTVITGARTLLSIHNATIWMPWRDFAQLFHPIFDRQRCRGSVWIIDPWLAEMAIFPGCPYPLIIRSLRAWSTRSQLRITQLALHLKSIPNLYIPIKYISNFKKEYFIYPSLILYVCIYWRVFKPSSFYKYCIGFFIRTEKTDKIIRAAYF